MQLRPIVRQTCRDFNVTYKSFDSYTDLLHELLTYLKLLSNRPTKLVPTITTTGPTVTIKDGKKSNGHNSSS